MAVRQETAAGEQPSRALPGPPVTAGSPFGAGALSKLGHELRSPLTSIIGLTRVMLMRLNAGTVDTVTQVRQLEMVQAAAARSLVTIERVVDLAKIESGGVRPVPQLVDCGAIVADVAAELRAAAGERGLRLCIEVPDRPVVVSGDPDILAQLLRELVDNGLRFTDAGEVRIRLHPGDELVVIDVSDDGPGIPIDEQARIFGPFERGELGAGRDDGAAGLGLYLARKQADLLGARLSLSSQAGSGSTFSIAFPDRRARPEAGHGSDPGS
jgi:signal transduction histidine kinase